MTELEITKNSAGRPREHDREAIGEKLIVWAKLEDSLNLNAFCSENLITPSKLGMWAKECDIFRTAYELAKSFIAIRREKKLSKGELHVKAYDLNAATYDYFLKQERMEEKAYEASLKNVNEEKQPNKIVFEVNYKNDSNNPVSISPTSLPTSTSDSTK